jgi:hypothetical protein
LNDIAGKINSLKSEGEGLGYLAFSPSNKLDNHKWYLSYARESNYKRWVCICPDPIGSTPGGKGNPEITLANCQKSGVCKEVNYALKINADCGNYEGYMKDCISLERDAKALTFILQNNEVSVLSGKQNNQVVNKLNSFVNTDSNKVLFTVFLNDPSKFNEGSAQDMLQKSLQAYAQDYDKQEITKTHAVLLKISSEDKELYIFSDRNFFYNNNIPNPFQDKFIYDGKLLRYSWIFDSSEYKFRLSTQNDKTYTVKMSAYEKISYNTNTAVKNDPSNALT